MKKILLLLTLISFGCVAQNNPANWRNGIETKFISLDTLTTAQRDAITLKASKGYVIFNADTNVLNLHDGTSWGEIGGGGETLQNVIDAGDLAQSPNTSNYVLLDVNTNANTSSIDFGLDDATSNLSQFRQDIYGFDLNAQQYVSGARSQINMAEDFLRLRRSASTFDSNFLIGTPIADEVDFFLNTPSGTSANTDYYIPLSVNGTFADVNGNITISATETPYTAYLTIGSTNTQAAINELKDERDVTHNLVPNSLSYSNATKIITLNQIGGGSFGVGLSTSFDEKISSDVTGRTAATEYDNLYGQTQAGYTTDGAPAAGTLVFITDASPAEVVTTATIAMDGWKMYDDQTADAATLTLSDCDPGETLSVYINRASQPLLQGAGLSFLKTSGDFAANIPIVMKFEVAYNGTTIDYKYESRVPQNPFPTNAYDFADAAAPHLESNTVGAAWDNLGGTGVSITSQSSNVYDGTYAIRLEQLTTSVIEPDAGITVTENTTYDIYIRLYHTDAGGSLPTIQLRTGEGWTANLTSTVNGGANWTEYTLTGTTGAGITLADISFKFNSTTAGGLMDVDYIRVIPQ